MGSHARGAGLEKSTLFQGHILMPKGAVKWEPLLQRVLDQLPPWPHADAPKVPGCSRPAGRGCHLPLLGPAGLLPGQEVPQANAVLRPLSSASPGVNSSHNTTLPAPEKTAHLRSSGTAVPLHVLHAPAPLPTAALRPDPCRASDCPSRATMGTPGLHPLPVYSLEEPTARLPPHTT